MKMDSLDEIYEFRKKKIAFLKFAERDPHTSIDINTPQSGLREVVFLTSHHLLLFFFFWRNGFCKSSPFSLFSQARRTFILRERNEGRALF